MMRLIPLFIIVITTVSSRHVNFYRKDYIYIEEYDAFYKMHPNSNITSFESMFMACDDEGAELFYPGVLNEWKVAHKLLEEMHDAPNISDIVVGVQDKYGLGEYTSVNGRPTNLPVNTVEKAERCVAMDVESGLFVSAGCDVVPQHSKRSFICKKVEDISCPTIDKAYKYAKETNKCYKVNKNHQTWQKAMETCYMEGGLLAVPGSELEAEVIKHYMASGEEYFAGINRLYHNGEFYTVKGHKVQDSGFNRWYDNGDDYNKDCGALWSNDHVYIRSVSCDEKSKFICEMEITTV